METTASQYRRYIIRPVLEVLGLWSQAAENLLIGTAAHESNGFRAIHQYGRGPALSIYQIEPATHDDLWTHTMPGIARRLPQAARAVEGMIPRQYTAAVGNPPAPELLLLHVGYATAIARLLYWRAPGALPAADDLAGLAAYWKRFYNTVHGAGHESEWLDAYAEHCA